MFSLSKFAILLLQPTMIAFLTFSLGALLLFTRRWKWGRNIVFLGLVLHLVPAFVPINSLLTSFLEDRFPAPSSDPAHIDGIIVLGGSINLRVSELRGRPTVASAADRIFALAVLARKFPQARIVFTGGSGDALFQEFKEAQAVKDLLARLGIPTDRITFEDRARNTHENAVNSKELMKPAPGQDWVLVTSAMHMPRAVGAFRAVDWPVIAYPVDYTSAGPITPFSTLESFDPSNSLVALDPALHELVGLAYYRLRGWTTELIPRPLSSK